MLNSVQGGDGMSHESKKVFSKIEQKSNLSVDDIYRIAQSIQHADFSDEHTVRKIVQNLSQMTNRPISIEKEDQIVQSIVNNQIPRDIESLQQFLK